MNSDSQNIYQKYTLVNERIDASLLADENALVGGTLTLPIKGSDRNFTITKVETSPTNKIAIFGKPNTDYTDLKVDMSDTNSLVAGIEYRIIDEEKNDNNILSANYTARDHGTASTYEWKEEGSVVTLDPTSSSTDSKTSQDKTTRQKWADYAFKGTDVGDDPLSQGIEKKFHSLASGEQKADIEDYQRWADG
tara:strand:- start:44 stop:622 length:579 start_codon:yes stop_codon:yes gene_type:complete